MPVNLVPAVIPKMVLAGDRLAMTKVPTQTGTVVARSKSFAPAVIPKMGVVEHSDVFGEHLLPRVEALTETPGNALAIASEAVIRLVCAGA